MGMAESTAVAETRAKGAAKGLAREATWGVAVETAMATEAAAVLESWVELVALRAAVVEAIATPASHSRSNRCRESTATFESPRGRRRSARCE